MKTLFFVEKSRLITVFPSGTYNNQYMVLDMSKVSLGSKVDDGALVVVEQIPGLVEYSDQTQTLRRGTAPSHTSAKNTVKGSYNAILKSKFQNIAIYVNISKMSGNIQTVIHKIIPYVFKCTFCYW